MASLATDLTFGVEFECVVAYERNQFPEDEEVSRYFPEKPVYKKLVRTLGQAGIAAHIGTDFNNFSIWTITKNTTILPNRGESFSELDSAVYNQIGVEMKTPVFRGNAQEMAFEEMETMLRHLKGLGTSG